MKMLVSKALSFTIHVHLMVHCALNLGYSAWDRPQKVLKTSLYQDTVIPCNPSIKILSEKLHTVKWYFGSRNKLLFRYDYRNKRNYTMRGMESKILFTQNPYQPALILRSVRVGQGGHYKCHVKYWSGKTAEWNSKLMIKHPPTRLEMSDPRTGYTLTRKVTRAEGNPINLVCSALGGYPEPQLIWKKESIVIDSSFESKNGKSINLLDNWDSVKRLESGTLVTCEVRQMEGRGEIRRTSSSLTLKVVAAASQEAPEKITKRANATMDKNTDDPDSNVPSFTVTRKSVESELNHNVLPKTSDTPEETSKSPVTPLSISTSRNLRKTFIPERTHSNSANNHKVKTSPIPAIIAVSTINYVFFVL